MAATSPAVQGTQLRCVALIGGFSFQRGEEAVELPLAAQRLIAYLALKPKALLRVHVAGVLWAQTSEAKAVANLRTTLWRLRQIDSEIVESSGSQLAIDQSVSVDVREMATAARRVLARPPDTQEEDVGRFPLGGEVLPDWYDEWLLIERERFRQLRLHALEAACDGLAARGRYARAVEAALAAVELDPLRESAHRALIRAHVAEGNISEAAREAEAFCALIHSSLGLPPSPRMRRIAAELRIPWRPRDAAA